MWLKSTGKTSSGLKLWIRFLGSNNGKMKANKHAQYAWSWLCHTQSWWSLVCCLRAVDCPLLQTWGYTAHFSSKLGVNSEMNLIMIAGWFSQPRNFRTFGNVRFFGRKLDGTLTIWIYPIYAKKRLEIQALELLMVRWRWWYAHGSSLLKSWMEPNDSRKFIDLPFLP